MKTLKQMADEIGVSKQRVYRFVKQEGILGTYQKNQTIYYDEQTEQIIKNAFQTEPHHETASDVADTAEPHHETVSNVGDAVCNMAEPHRETVSNVGDAACNTAEPHHETVSNVGDAVCNMAEPHRETVSNVGDAACNTAEPHRETAPDLVTQGIKYNQHIIEVLQNTLTIMQQQIDTYHKELENRDKQIEQLQSELSAERQHNHEISDKLAQLADQAQRLQLIQMQPPALPVPDEEPTKQKPSFWKRIFGKKE